MKQKVTIYDEMIGKVFVNVDNQENEILTFTDTNGTKYMFYHAQECCESVQILDIVGSFNWLIGRPLIMAEETITEYPDGVMGYESATFTYYRFATLEGYVTIRWFGESNGYYSEKVDFRIMRKKH